MDKALLEKLKSNINEEFVNKFSLDEIKQERFIPINNKEGIIFVGLDSSLNLEQKKAALSKVMSVTKLKPQMISLDGEGFNELLGFVDEENEPLTQPSVSIPKPQVKSACKKRLGEILIEEGLIDDEKLAQALEESKRSETPVGSVLVKLGFITVDQLREALSKQQNVESVDAQQFKIEETVIQLLSEEFIKDNKVVPISSDGKTIVVGMVNPKDKYVLSEIVYLTGLKPIPLLLTHIEYEKCIQKYFKARRETDKLIEEIEQEEEQNIVASDDLWKQLEEELNDESNIVAKFASSIVIDAIVKKASDIHIEPRQGKSVVRYRIDGILWNAYDIPAKLEASLISRLKVISKMNITEHRRPQDGNFSLKYNSQSYDLRVNTLPVGTKEKMVIRVQQPALKVEVDPNKEKKIELMGAMPDDLLKIDQMVTAPSGILLVSGPTGSGKTTTLYNILHKVNDEKVNITTIEDPIEIKLDGINQTQINAKADITFASCMRAILRQDPDIIMLGEIRDMETLEIAIKAALTGHLVLSTIHTNSAAATITRLVDMGAPNYLVSSALVGVVAQRLVRKLCPMCKESYIPLDEEIKQVVLHDDFEPFKQNNVYKACGCDMCFNTGFSGRLGIYEIMPVSREMKKSISASSSEIELEELAVGSGMKTLKDACVENILNGETTIDEYIRVLGIARD